MPAARIAAAPSPTARPTVVRGARAACLVGALALVGGPARAGSEPGGADVRAVGGVTRANTSSPAAVLTASAILPLVGRYEIQGSGLAGPDKLLGVRAYAMDSNTGPVALGLAYHYDHSVPQTEDADLPGWVLPGDDFTNEKGRAVFGGGLATSFAERRLGLGMTFTWNTMATRFGDLSQWAEGGVSVAGRIGDDQQVIISGAVDNILAPGREETPLTFGVGTAVRPVPAVAILGQFDVATGMFDRPADIGFGVGAEAVAAEVVAFRAGFNRDPERRSDLMAGGLGARSETVALDYSAEFVVGHADEVPAGWDDDKLRSFHTVTLTLSF